MSVCVCLCVYVCCCFMCVCLCVLTVAIRLLRWLRCLMRSARFHSPFSGGIGFRNRGGAMYLHFRWQIVAELKLVLKAYEASSHLLSPFAIPHTVVRSCLVLV